MLAPILAATSPTTSRSKGLYVGGVDMIASPVRTTPFGVDPLDVTVVEAAPGQVSSLVATIDDTTSAIPLPAVDSIVRMHDHVLGLPLFLGFVQSVEAVTVGIGRQITIRGVGIEVVLDWLYVPAMTIPVGVEYTAGIQAIHAQAIGVGAPALNACAEGFTNPSTIATPVGIGIGGIFSTAAWTWNGGTLRQALTAYGAFINADDVDLGGGIAFGFTVDFHGGLRAMQWALDGSTTRTDGGLVQLRTSGAFPRPSNHRFGISATGAPRSAYVTGSGTGTGAVSDGSGVPGPTAAVTDPSSTNATALGRIGRFYLGKPTRAAGGSVRWEGAVLSATPAVSSRRAGDPVEILDPSVGLPAATSFAMLRITKTYTPGEETWDITYGGEAPSVVELVRRLTRAVLPRH